jgi:hypothetical protein
MTIANVSHTVTLPSSVTIGADTLQGIIPSTKVITFDAIGTYIFEFTTDDAGTTVAVNDLTRSRIKMDIRTPVNVGQSGDVQGMTAVNAAYIYVCTGTYDGSTVIWKRVAISAY